MDEITWAALRAVVSDMFQAVDAFSPRGWRSEVQVWALQLNCLIPPVLPALAPPPPPPPPPACVHNWQAVDYWRDLGILTVYCTRCPAVERREVPR